MHIFQFIVFFGLFLVTKRTLDFTNKDTLLFLGVKI